MLNHEVKCEHHYPEKLNCTIKNNRMHDRMHIVLKNQLKAGEASISTTIIQKGYWHYPLYKYLIFSYT